MYGDPTVIPVESGIHLGTTVCVTVRTEGSGERFLAGLMMTDKIQISWPAIALTYLRNRYGLNLKFEI